MRKLFGLCLLALLLLGGTAAAEILSDNDTIYYDNGYYYDNHQFNNIRAQALMGGEPAPSGMFTFQLYDANGNPVGNPLVNGENGTVTLPTIILPGVDEYQTEDNKIALNYRLKLVSSLLEGIVLDTHEATLEAIAYRLPNNGKYYGYSFKNRVFRNYVQPELGKMPLKDAVGLLPTVSVLSNEVDVLVYSGEENILTAKIEIEPPSIAIDGELVAMDEAEHVILSRIQAVVGGNAEDLEEISEELMQYPAFVSLEDTQTGKKLVVRIYLPEITLDAYVVQDGYSAPKDKHVLQLKDETGKTILRKTVYGAGKTSFRLGFNLDNVGVNRYSIEQLIPADGKSGVVYDDTVHTVTIDVIRTQGDAQAQNVLQVEANPLEVTFTNLYTGMPAEESEVPPTGDGAFPMLWAALTLAAMFVLCRRRKSHI